MSSSNSTSLASMASRPDCLICPLCEASPLRLSGCDSMGCVSCDGRLSGAMLATLRGISALPDALGRHACEECGHPEMRPLPNDTFHCPACGSEVLPIDASAAPSRAEKHGEAYWAGWVDSRFGERDSFADKTNMVRWGNPSERLEYFRGHRAGNEARRAMNSPKADDTREKLFG